VRITLTDLGATTVTVKITRTVSGESLVVPGAIAWDVVDSGVLVDYAAPLNLQTTYTLYVDGVIADVKTITLESAYPWIQDPRNPGRSLPIRLDAAQSGFLKLDQSAARNYAYRGKSKTMDVMGDPMPVAFGGQRQAASGVPLNAHTNDEATRAAFKQLISEAPILLVRATAQMVDMPPLGYLLCDVAPEHRTINAAGSWTFWNINGDFVRPVLQQVVSGFLTYDDVQAVLGVYTYDEVQAVAAGTTYLDWEKNPLIFTTL
jgi:hypothetical protein